METEESTKTKALAKQKKWIVYVIGGFAVIVLAAAIGGLIYYNSASKPKKELQKQLELGEKYLSNLDYDNAILAYKTAISIDEKIADAYIGLANAFVGKGMYAEADEVFGEALRKITDGTDVERIKQIQEKIIEPKVNEEEKTVDKEDETDKEEQVFMPEVDYNAIYEPVLKDNLDMINNYAGKDVYTGDFLPNYQYASGSIAMEINYSDRDSLLNRIGYVIMDINDDGICELLLGEKSESRTLIWTGYTYKEGEIIDFLNGGYRHDCYWIRNGEFMCTSNGSAWDCIFAHNYLKKGASELTCDNYYFSTTYNYEDTVYYRNNTTYSEDVDKAESVTKDEFEQFYNGFDYEILDLTPLESIGY